MSLIKKGTCKSDPVVSSSVYTCVNCGHTEMGQNITDSIKLCAKCQGNMQLISAQFVEEENGDETTDLSVDNANQIV